jgi:hypothetical protein
MTAPTLSRKLAATPAEALAMAAAVVTERGLHKGSYYRLGAPITGPVCAAGALRVAVYGSPAGDPPGQLVGQDWLFRDACGLLAAHLGVHRNQVPKWNDDPATTRTQVVAALLAAAPIHEHNFSAPGEVTS